MELTTTQLKYRDLARQLARDYLAPDAARIDREAAYPVEHMRRFAKLGLCGLTIPTEYGGLGVDDALTICLFVEELTKGCPSTAAALMVYSLGGAPILEFGSPEQKQTYLPAFSSGKSSVCFAMTEAQGGSDVAGTRTTAEREGDGWVINGVKVQIGNGATADVCVVAAKTDVTQGNKGISAFVVDMRTAGVSVSQIYEKLGMRGTTTAELTFDHVKVPAKALLGGLGMGLPVFLKSLDMGRLILAAQAIGIAQSALDESVTYAKNRIVGGAPLSANQSIQFTLAEMAVSVHAARSMMYIACGCHARKEPYSMESAMTKLFASDTACRVTEAAMHIHGGWGLIERSKVERLFRDARFTRIWNGTSEAQKMVISRNLIAAAG